MGSTATPSVGLRAAALVPMPWTVRIGSTSAPGAIVGGTMAFRAEETIDGACRAQDLVKWHVTLVT